MSDLRADLTSHRIEGIAREGGVPFSVPLISHVDGNLWQGGCLNGVTLPDHFRFVVSLYPWESYVYDSQKVGTLSVPLYDTADGEPDRGLLVGIASWVNTVRALGPTLVHCQAGLNRSALVAGLALILDGTPAADAIALLREKRSPAVLCNATFERWLREFQP